MAKKYATTEEYWYNETTKSDKEILAGIKEFDEYFEKTLEVAEDHRLERFEYYIKLRGWEIVDITNNFDFEFEW